MGRLTEIFATVAEPYQDKHRYAYISPNKRCNRRAIKEMQKRKAELDKLMAEQAVDMGSGKVILPKPKRRKMTKEDYGKWQRLKDSRGRL